MLANPTTFSLTASQRVPADALGPRQSVGPGLELAGDERCPPEDPEDAGTTTPSTSSPTWSPWSRPRKAVVARRAVAVCLTAADVRVVEMYAGVDR